MDCFKTRGLKMPLASGNHQDSEVNALIDCRWGPTILMVINRPPAHSVGQTRCLELVEVAQDWLRHKPLWACQLWNRARYTPRASNFQFVTWFLKA